MSALGLGLVVYGILRSGTWGFVQPKSGAPQWLGLSPVVWLVLAGGAVLLLFLAWESRRVRRDESSLIDPYFQTQKMDDGALLAWKALVVHS